MADYLVSTTDPDATLTETKNGTAMGYRTHYMVDGGKSRIILQVLVTPSEVMDNQPMRDLVFRTCFRWKLRPRYPAGARRSSCSSSVLLVEVMW
jgi:hypothetical protein